MSAVEQLAALRRLQVPAVTTMEAASVLDLSVTAASHSLRRLAALGLVVPIRKGLWSLGERPDPMALLEYVTAPWPSYVSLHSALHLHGMIEQIPAVLYAVTLGRSARIASKITAYSTHHVAPEFFGGFEVVESGIKRATPEKALVDVFYLSSTRTRLFSALPELELPRSFRLRIAREWVARIPSNRLRSIAGRRLDAVLASRERKS